MSKNKPLVSICIPTYNMYPYVIQTIQSAINQTYDHIEIVVLENSSSDRSREEIDIIFSSDPRVKIYYNDITLPIYDNWNACVRYSTGEYFMVLNADDIIAPVFIENCLSVFQKSENLGYVFAEWYHIDANNLLGQLPSFYKKSGIIPAIEELRINLIGSHTHPSSMLIKRQLYEEVGGYENELGLAADMHFRLKLNMISDVGYLNYKLWYYRRHPNQETSARLLKVLYSIHVVKKNIYKQVKYRYENHTEIWHQFISKFEKDVALALVNIQGDEHTTTKQKYEQELDIVIPDISEDMHNTSPESVPSDGLWPLPAGAVVFE